ncbi:FimV/HubP family polar landmark protein [Pseudomonas sp. NA-150]|uniref:FimV/HubP family polar landmark protein n=1 Tax=Pseudomonas sp. NA-150 TaxID=3367525 RepID=UPI0037C92F8F
MVQVRKLVLAIAAASALSSGMAHALGLGELTLKSTLNQPLVAEIELLDAKDLRAGQVVPSLANSADFAHAGVDRQAFLDDLTFTPVINASGKSVLRITSTKPIRDPYMKFLVQVLWPNGRLLREYSVLLDPPKATPEAAATAQLPATAPAPAEAPQSAPAPVEMPAATPAVEAKPAQYTTTKRDTLWVIAARLRTGGSVQQTMLAIQALNPDAFIAGNINRLKTGQVLRLPDAQQVAATAQPQAVAQVHEQNLAWRQRRALPAGPRQVDATRHAKAEAAPRKVETPDNLSLVSGTSKGDKGAAGDGKAVSNRLAVAKENLDTTRRDNSELKSRMTDLQSQLDKLQRLIQLKNDQLAKMQADGGTAKPTPAPAPTDTAVVSPSVPAALVTAPPVADISVKPPGEIAPEDALPPPADVTPAPEAQPITATTPDETDNANSTFNKLLASPLLMGLIGGGALVVLLLLLLLLARRRNAQQEAEKHKRMARALAEESEFASDMDLPDASFAGLEVPPPSVKLTPVAAAPVEPVRERSADVLEQAKTHIANGRLNSAAELLEDATKEQPERSDLRLQLMEVYAQQGDRSGFTGQERKLVANGANHAEVEQLKSRFPLMATVAATAAVGAAAVVASQLDANYVKSLLQDNEPAPAPAPVVTPAPAPVEPTPVAKAAEPDDFDHDFDLSLDDLEEASPAVIVDKTKPALDDLDLDHEISLDAPLAAAADDDDLSFESIMQQQSEVRQSTPEDLADFDLDLSEEQPKLNAEDDFLLSLQDDLRDLPAFDDAPDLAQTPVAGKAPVDDLSMPEDFDLSLADELDTGPNAFTDELNDVNAELDRLSASLEQPPMAKPFEVPSFTAEDALLHAEDEPEFDFLAGTDEAATKLDLARAYIEMGDADGARDILDEVVGEGDEHQKTEAREMLSRLA